MIISLLIINTSTVFAGTLGPNENHPTGDNSTIAMQKYNEFWDTYDSLYNAVHPTQDQIKSFVSKSFGVVGFLLDETAVTFDKIRHIISGTNNSGITDSSTEDEVGEWIKNNVSGDQNNGIIYNSNYNSFVDNFATDFESNSGFWTCYAFDLRYMSGQFTGTAKYNGLKSLLSVSDNIVGVVWSAYNNVCLVPLDDYWFRVNNANWNGTVLYTYANGTTAPINGGYEKYTWNSTLNEYVKDTNLYNAQLSGVAVSLTPQNTSTADAKVLWYGVKEINVFNSVATATTYGVGAKPYYYNTNTWNDFSNKTGDYTVDNSNINTVTYGDTVSYIQDSYNETGNYPDNSTVNNWITNTNNDNHSTSGGGGSGGDNGGGSGSGDSDVGIFDFLSRIGAVLGNLIKNLGDTLAELIEGIAEVVSTLFESIPTVFGDFLGALLGWLPEELRALIMLGISAMIIVGLIKMFKS